MKKLKPMIAMLMLIVLIFTSNATFAAWWGNQYYEWALRNKLTSVKTVNQLNQPVTHSDLYATILKYLDMKGVYPKGRLVHHNDTMENLDNVVAGLFTIINSYISKQSLTPDEYRIVESYVAHARKTFDTYSSYLVREDLKNVDLYLRLSQYRAALIINDKEYRELVLSRLGNVKYKEILDYGIIPYADRISRKEFLLLMYDLLADRNSDETNIINSFYESDILEGYVYNAQDFKLDRDLTYAEMYTFLNRFEIYDFNPDVTTEETEE